MKNRFQSFTTILADWMGGMFVALTASIFGVESFVQANAGRALQAKLDTIMSSWPMTTFVFVGVRERVEIAKLSFRYLFLVVIAGLSWGVYGRALRATRRNRSVVKLKDASIIAPHGARVNMEYHWSKYSGFLAVKTAVAEYAALFLTHTLKRRMSIIVTVRVLYEVFFVDTATAVSAISRMIQNVSLQPYVIYAES